MAKQVQVPDSVRKIVEAVVSRALARCDRLGIPWEDFRRALCEQGDVCPKDGLCALIARTFRSLGH